MRDPADPRSVTIQHLREAAAGHVENTSLRKAAREVGMSPTGLKKFLEGTVPYAFTVRRLRSWYVRHSAAQPSAIGVEEAGAALGVLVHDLLPRPRREAALSVLEAVGRGYEDSGKTHPAWLAALRTRYEAA